MKPCNYVLQIFTNLYRLDLILRQIRKEQIGTRSRTINLVFVLLDAIFYGNLVLVIINMFPSSGIDLHVY